ncbi:MAG: hypothetical protein GYB64_09095, partial [Chloroflexi bacterium]|nr:hypothetical protein [Chloroflexota bacterium]
MMYVHRVVVLAAVVVTAGIVLAACQPQDPQLVVFVTATAPAAEAEAGPATGVIPEAPPPATLDPL